MNTGLPSQHDKDTPTIKGDLAKQLYPDHTYDLALPQEWVNKMTTEGFDPRGHAVWIYQHGFVFGEPAALTQEFFNWYLSKYKVCPVCPAALT